MNILTVKKNCDSLLKQTTRVGSSGCFRDNYKDRHDTYHYSYLRIFTQAENLTMPGFFYHIIYIYNITYIIGYLLSNIVEKLVNLFFNLKEGN